MSAIRIIRRFRDLLDVTFGVPADQDVVLYDLGTDMMVLGASPGGPPSGAAGGDLSGTYPNPLFGAGIDRVDGVNEVWTLTITGAPTGGTFTLLVGGVPTTALAFNSTAAQVQAALVLLSQVGPGGAVCAGGPLPGTPITIERTGPWAAMTPNTLYTVTNALTGGAAPAVTVTKTTAAFPLAPNQLATQVGAAGIYLANGDAIKLGNAAGTSWVAALSRDPNNLVVLRGGGIHTALVADAQGRVSIGPGYTLPSVYSGEMGAIVMRNSSADAGALTGSTEVLIVAGARQITGSVDLLRFLDAAGLGLGLRVNENGYLIIGKIVAPADAELDPSEGNWYIASGLPLWKGKNAGGVVQALTPVDTSDSRLSNARTPTAHATSHQQGGSDPIKLDDLATPDDNTDLDSSAARHGLLRKLSGNAAEFLDGSGGWASPSGTGIPATIVDVKGDLIAATAADAVARLAAGANETVLVADSAQASGLVWKQIDTDSVVTTVPWNREPEYVTGQYYICGEQPYNSGYPGNGSQTVARASYVPFYVYTTRTFDRIAVYLVTNAAAGGLCRLGIYNDNNGVPGTVLLDAGTVATDAGAPAIKAITISQQLTPGRYWAACVQQTASGAFRRTIPLSPNLYLNSDWTANTFSLASVTGAFGNNPGVSSGSSFFPTLVGLRAV